MDDRARVVLDVARVVSSEIDTESVLAKVLESARDLTCAEYAALGVLDDSKQRLARFLTLGVDEATRREIGSLPTGHGVLGELIRDPRPLRIAEVALYSRSYGFPSGHPPMRSFLGVPILIDGEPYGNLYLTEKRGGEEFSDEDEEALIALASFAGLAIKNSQRYVQSERQRLALERSVAALDASLQISRALGTETNLDAVLGLVAKRGRALVDARTVVIEALERDELVVAAAAGELPAGLVGRRVAVKDTVASVALETQSTQRLEDPANQARFQQYGLGQAGLQVTFGLVVPLVFRRQGYGVMLVADRLGDGGPYSAEETSILQAFAGAAATAVATAHTATLERRRQRLAATEQERARWARELHDETLQGLASIRLMIGALRRADQQANGKHDADSPSDQHLRAITDQLGYEITTLRGLITELRPAALDEAGIEHAIHALAERSNRVHDLDVQVDIRLPSDHQPGQKRNAELETAIYRIIQEALTNAHKHGHATNATVHVTHQDGDIHITVKDNGSGFDPHHRHTGLGLLGMQERAELLNGTVTVHSHPGNGTTIHTTLPTSNRFQPLSDQAPAKGSSVR